MPYLFYSSFVIFFFFFSADNAKAYIDPGSGSLIIQVILGTLLGALLTIKIYFQKIKNFFFRKNKKIIPEDKGQKNDD